LLTPILGIASDLAKAGQTEMALDAAGSIKRPSSRINEFFIVSLQFKRLSSFVNKNREKELAQRIMAMAFLK